MVEHDMILSALNSFSNLCLVIIHETITNTSCIALHKGNLINSSRAEQLYKVDWNSASRCGNKVLREVVVELAFITKFRLCIYKINVV